MSERNVDDDAYDRDEYDRDEYDDYDPNPGERGKWVSAVIALLGLWMILEAVLADIAAIQFWNDVIVGGVIFAVGGYNYSRRSDERIGSTAAAVVAVLAGLWLIAAPFLFGIDTGLTETVNFFGFWNDIVVGLIVAVLGAYSAYEARDTRSKVATPAER